MATDGSSGTARHLRPAEADGSSVHGANDAVLAANQSLARTVDDLRDEIRDLQVALERSDRKVESQQRLLTEVIRKYERAVHERNMVEKGTLGYRGAVKVAKKLLPTPVYFRVRKMVRGT